MPTAPTTCLLVAAAVLGATTSVLAALVLCAVLAAYEFMLPYVGR